MDRRAEFQYGKINGSAFYLVKFNEHNCYADGRMRSRKHTTASSAGLE